MAFLDTTVGQDNFNTRFWLRRLMIPHVDDEDFVWYGTKETQEDEPAREDALASLLKKGHTVDTVRKLYKSDAKGFSGAMAKLDVPENIAKIMRSHFRYETWQNIQKLLQKRLAMAPLNCRKCEAPVEPGWLYCTQCGKRR
jgi:hypothetical protein